MPGFVDLLWGNDLLSVGYDILSYPLFGITPGWYL
jgi:hypothetical protein